MGFEFDERDADAVLRRVAPEVLDKLKAGTPRRGGRLASLWKLDNVKNGIAQFSTTFYGRFVDKGTAPHTIKAKPGKTLAIGGGHYRSVRHPGARAQNFIEKLQSEAADDIGARIAELLRKRVSKQ